VVAVTAAQGVFAAAAAAAATLGRGATCPGEAAPHAATASSHAPINAVVASPLTVSKDLDHGKLAARPAGHTPAATRGDQGMTSTETRETATRRAAVYCRISDDREGKGLGVERQREDCVKLCELRGWNVAAVYTDNDISASSGKARPQYRAMMASLERGELDAVVTYSATRLHRNVSEQEAFISAVRARGRDVVTVETVSGGPVNVHKAEGRMTARITGAVAVGESEQISERQQRKMVEVAQAGRPHGGLRAYGYRNVYAFDAAGNKSLQRVDMVEDEVKHIRTAVDMILSGASLYAAATRINATGARTTSKNGGTTWKETTLRRMLTNPRLVGKRSHAPEVSRYTRSDGRVVIVRGDAVEYAAIWPAIVTPTEHAQLKARIGRRAAIAQSKRRDDGVNHSGENGAGNHVRHLLTGLLFCGKCGHILIHRPKTKNQRETYGCPAKLRGGCNGTSITADVVERYVIERVGRFIAAPVANPASITDAVERMTAVNAQDHAALVSLQTAYAAGIVGIEDFAPTATKLRAQIAARTSELDATAVSVDTTARRATLAENWDTLDADERREALRLALDSIVITPSRTRGRLTAEGLAAQMRDRATITTAADMAEAQREAEELGDTPTLVRPITRTETA
jgi:site-specific DNA recombinase